MSYAITISTMNSVIFLLFICNVTCLLISSVELKFSEEYRDPNDVVRISTELEQDDEKHNIEYQIDRDNSHEVENKNKHDEEMQLDEASPIGEAENQQNIEMTSSTEPTETIYASSSIPTPLNEDIPRVTSSTETIKNTVEFSSTVPYATTEETNSETTLATNDSENTVEDVLIKSTTPSDDFSTAEINKIKIISVNKLSDQIKIVLQQYKTTGNVIVPNIKIPDPMPIPDMEKRVSMVSMTFKNQTVHGLSNFTIQHVNTDLEKMQVYVMLHMKQLIVLGNYSMKSFISKASGPFNVTLLDVITEGAAALHYNSKGELEASETDMDMSFSNIKLDFKNLGIMGSFFQGVLGAVGNLIFEGIKSPILTEVNTKMKDDVNEKIRLMSSNMKSNASIKPVDQAVLEGRRYIKSQGYDPYTLTNYSMNLAGLLKLNLTELSLRGLSRFYRVGEVSLSMDNGTVEFGIHLAADNLTGSCRWSAGFGPSKIRDGASTFVVDNIQGRAIIKQSLDLSRPPQLDDIDFRLGEVKLRTTREDALDLLAESIVNNLPLLVRHIIVDGIEHPVKIQVQKILDQVDVGNIVEQQLPNIDKMGV